MTRALVRLRGGLAVAGGRPWLTGPGRAAAMELAKRMSTKISRCNILWRSSSSGLQQKSVGSTSLFGLCR